jgi:hypothetical protein
MLSSEPLQKIFAFAIIQIFVAGAAKGIFCNYHSELMAIVSLKIVILEQTRQR